MNCIKNIKLLIFAGSLLQVAMGFGYNGAEEGEQILGNIRKFDKIHVSNLIKAAQEGDLEALKSALNDPNTNINEVDKHNATALMYAVRLGRKGKVIVELLISHGADPHIITRNDKTALREAINGGHKEIIKKLLDVNSKFRQRSIDCALIEASYKGDKDSVNLLLNKGANPNTKACSSDPNGPPIETTPLIQAAKNGDRDIVRFLLDKGANPNIENGHGYTALQIAKNKGYKEIVQLISHSAGCSYNDLNKQLMNAVINSKAEDVKACIVAGASINAKDKDDKTILMAAVEKGHTDIVQILIAAGADVNTGSGRFCHTPLFIATEKGHTDIVRILMAAGANSRDSDFESILVSAVHKGNIEMVKALLSTDAYIEPGALETALGFTYRNTEMKKIINDHLKRVDRSKIID